MVMVMAIVMVMVMVVVIVIVIILLIFLIMIIMLLSIKNLGACLRAPSPLSNYVTGSPRILRYTHFSTQNLR